MQNCKICKRSYKNIDAINVHLNRKSHYSKVIKMECLLSQNPDSEAYNNWLKIKEECDRPRENPQS